MKVSNFMARQFSHPSGIFGRLVTGALLNRSNAKSNALIFSMMDIAPDERVLEVGFGGGDLLFKIARHPHCKVVYGLERSEQMIRHATGKAKRAGKTKEVRLYNGVSEALPFENRSFDHVCSVNTVYFWPELSDSVAEFHRVLRDEGELLLGFGDASVLQRQGYTDKGFIPYTPSQIRVSLVRGGFEIVEERCIRRSKRGNFYAFRYKKPGSHKRRANEQ